MNGGIDERLCQKKASHGDRDAGSHVPILQSIWLSGKTRTESVADTSKKTEEVKTSSACKTRQLGS
jgi:hypothetical protein